MVKKPTKSSKNQTKLGIAYKTIRSHKLIVFLLLLIMIFLASFAYEKYKDWDNAQMIKGLSRDFPELVEQIEKATGLELEVESNCMTTTEKFSNGVKTCEFTVGYVGLNDAEEIINTVLKNSNKFTDFINFRNNTGMNFKYRNKDACDIGYAEIERFNASCIIAIRENNVNLAKELLSK